MSQSEVCSSTVSNSKEKDRIKVRKMLANQFALDPEYKNKTWKSLELAFQHIHKKNASCISFEELYRSAYTMVLHKHGDFLYQQVYDMIRDHLIKVAKSLQEVPNANFLESFQRAWTDHKTSQIMIRDVLMYLNSVYVPSSGIANIYDFGLALFRDKVIKEPEIKRRLLELLLDLVARDRDGEIVNRLILKWATIMLIDLGCGSSDIYINELEIPYINATKAMLHNESIARLASGSIATYLVYSENRLKDETDRVIQCLDKSSEAKLRIVCEKEILTAHLNAIVCQPESGLVSMLENDKLSDLHRMYVLLSRVAPDGHNLMRKELATHLKQVGAKIISDVEQQRENATFVEGLLTLHDKYEKILKKAFCISADTEDKQFEMVINQAFETFINASQRSPEYLSLHIDEQLRKGLKGATDVEIDTALERIMILFRYIREKDVFEKYYKQHLARRLLMGNSINDDAERQMISKFKHACGFQFTAKLEGMFTDIRISAETNEQFAAYVSNIDKKDPEVIVQLRKHIGLTPEDGNPFACDINVHVLTSGYWQVSATTLCNLPNDVLAASKMFKKFYLGNHSGRRLTYQTNLGTADVKMLVDKKRYELTVSTYQMVILMQFNARTSNSVKELVQLTGITSRDILRYIVPLTNGKHPVLIRTGNDKTTNPTEDSVFTYNTKFKAKLLKIRIGGLTAQKEDQTQVTQTRSKVDEDRTYNIEAAVVRIMKSRKTLSHNELISETIKLLQTRFTAEPAVIKKRIEVLMEREYLERDKDDSRVYHYLA